MAVVVEIRESSTGEIDADCVIGDEVLNSKTIFKGHHNVNSIYALFKKEYFSILCVKQWTRIDQSSHLPMLIARTVRSASCPSAFLFAARDAGKESSSISDDF